jgi:hypothetical protein
MPGTINAFPDAESSKHLLAIDPNLGWIQTQGHLKSIQINLGFSTIITDLDSFRALAELIGRAAINLDQYILPVGSAA